MEKSVRIFKSPSDAEAADREFYRSLSGPERVRMALEIIWRPYGDSPPDLRELCERFVSAKIEFIVVGAFAAIELGVPRYTGDLDFWVRRTAENASKIVRALDEFGFGSLGLQETDFLEEGTMIQLGRAPSRLDILNFLTALTFEEAWSNKRSGDLDGIDVYFLSKQDLLTNKRALGRPKDLFDVQQIEDLDSRS